MNTIQLKNIEYSYTSHYKAVFKDVNLEINNEWKLGLIGRNGRGKTTLLKLINGDLQVDSGSIVKKVKTEIFPYKYLENYSITMDLIKDNIGEYFEIERAMAACLEGASEKDYIKYSELIYRYNEIDGYEIESMIKREFAYMKLDEEMLFRPFDTLSGGEKTKALIVALFLRKNYFLLLDEPTNHLDIEGKTTLANYLKKKKGFIVVSHDRNFLDNTIDHILSINKANIEIEKGIFSSWNHNRLNKETYELRRKANIESEVRMMEKSSKESRRFSLNKEREKKGASDKGFVGARSARLMKRAKSIERRQNRQLDEKKKLLKNFDFIPELEIIQSKIDAKEIINIYDLSFSFGEKKLFEGLNISIEAGDCVWVRGANGSGKSTLLNILRRRIKGYSGYIKIRSDLIITESYQEALWKDGYLDERLRENNIDVSIFRNVLSHFNMSDEYFERPIESYSQGELKKVDIARSLSVKNQIIILDEPLNYMDIFFREQLENAILKCKPTLIFVEHDVHFAKKIANKILHL